MEKYYASDVKYTKSAIKLNGKCSAVFKSQVHYCPQLSDASYVLAS